MYIITGMHRSGTSLVAKCFFNAGADMGNTEGFYPADRWNPEGYYEQEDIHAVNMPLINGPWGKFAYFFLPSEQTILKRATSLSEKIIDTAAKYHDKVVKENRFCLTLPAWRRYGTKVKGIVLCLREPIQVARSLKKRNHIPYALSFKLWYAHNRRLLDAASDLPIHLISYHSLLSSKDSVSEIFKALTFFGLEVTEDKCREVISQSVRLDMNHSSKISGPCPDYVQALWNDLKQRHGDQSNEC